jgi:hypothetical protein
MPASVHSQDNDQSMLDAQAQNQDHIDETLLEQKRIIVVCKPDILSSTVLPYQL